MTKQVQDAGTGAARFIEIGQATLTELIKRILTDPDTVNIHVRRLASL